MQVGQLAILLSSAGVIVVALIGLYGTKTGGLLTRRTELDKIYMARLATVEDQLRAKQVECDTLRALIQELREQHIADLPSVERVKSLETQVQGLIEKLIGGTEDLHPSSRETD